MNASAADRRYDSYLRSDHWKRTRERALGRAGHECQKCGATDRRLTVHHTTYKRLGNERPSDLRVMCVPCHKDEHPEMEWWDTDAWVWVDDADCPLCGVRPARIQRCGDGRVAVMCLECRYEEIRRIRKPPNSEYSNHDRDPRTIKCPRGCTDKKFRNEYAMSQHLRDRHGVDWSNTPFGESESEKNTRGYWWASPSHRP